MHQMGIHCSVQALVVLCGLWAATPQRPEQPAKVLGCAQEGQHGMRHVRSNGSMSSMTSFEANRSRACSFGSVYSAMEE